MENKRMTWEEIVAKYPDKWVGLVDIDWKDGANVRSAVVDCFGDNSDRIAENQINNHKIYGVYTTPENLIWNLPLGALNVEQGD